MFEIFYDTETTGPAPRFDQVLQYAAIRTDEDFVELDTVDLRSQLVPHIIPTPGALKVTHVNPYDIARAPYNHYDYALNLHALISNWLAQGHTATTSMKKSCAKCSGQTCLTPTCQAEPTNDVSIISFSPVPSPHVTRIS